MELLSRKPTVLCILDEFSFNCFKPECEKLIPLHQKIWKDQLEENKIDFLLCESAWRPIGNYFVIGARDPKKRRIFYNQLKQITSYVKSLGIPTVFWNKEDNKHYNHFKAFAKLFDYIFTTDSRTLPLYRRECGQAKGINVLTFAAQPILHNPIKIEENKYEGDIFFAGGWYNFPARVQELNELLQLPGSIKLHIYERGFTGKNSKFPMKFRHRIRKGISYVEMSKKYKRYPIMLNVNSVKGSPTMFSRRVPEALLCGITVVTSPSLSISKLFPHVFISATSQRLETVIRNLLQNNEFRHEHNHNSRRNILQKHTYFNKMIQICKTIGIQPPKYKTGVINLYVTSDNSTHNHLLLSDIQKQTYNDVICNIEVSNNDVFMNVLKNLFLFRMLPDGNINENIGFVCVFHNKSRYEANYISDLISSYQYFKEIDIIGKACVNIWENDKLILNSPELEHVYTTNINPHTVSISLAGDVNKREKKLNYLKNVLYGTNLPLKNLKIYSSDRYNFVDIKND